MFGGDVRFGRPSYRSRPAPDRPSERRNAIGAPPGTGAAKYDPCIMTDSARGQLRFRSRRPNELAVYLRIHMAEIDFDGDNDFVSNDNYFT
jgi:hypothetical protein